MSAAPAPGTRRRNQWALPVLVALLVALPLLELWLLLKVGNWIGALPTIAILVVEAAFGAWLMRREGSRAWTALKQTLGSGRMPAAELTDAALILVGGVLLMLPGFFTDLFGFIFLLPFTRPLARSVVGFFAARQVARTGVEMDLLRARSDPGATVPGQVVDEPAPGSRPEQRRDQDGGEPPAITGTVL
ncbi:FxsA family protein [Luteococcus peritonei]|uniref:FxsA family protein n=1 Tax=Luteococcus peritonei TaxID=88874 RepID=A0ABW4RUE3_9ACTN